MTNKKLVSFIVRNNTQKETIRQIEKYVEVVAMNFAKDILKAKDEDPNEEWIKPKLKRFLSKVKL